MESIFPLLLSLMASNTPPMWATNAKTSDFEEMVCSQYQKWCGDTFVSSCDEPDSAGVFNLYIPGVGFKNVFCDVADDGGKWTVFQRRMNGNVDFYRDWNDYVNGFGDLRGDHWLGLEAMHQMTKDGNMEMQIKMIKTDGIYWIAKYSDFRIAPGSDNYRLHVSGFSGNATSDGLSIQNNRQFSTKDANHDEFVWGNCAIDFEAASWYGPGCAHSNLNGKLNLEGFKGFWWRIPDNHLRFSEMKFRKRS